MSPRPHILIIWNVTGDTGVLQDTLADLGEVSLAHSGTQGIRIALEAQPDLILLSAELPDMEGSHALSALKKDLRTTDVPVLFVAGRDDADTESRALVQGAADVLHTPLRAEVVRSRVQLHLALHRQARRLHAADLAEQAGLQMIEWVDDLMTTLQLAARQAADGLPVQAHCARMMSTAQNLKRALGPAGRAAALARPQTAAPNRPLTPPASPPTTSAPRPTTEAGEDHLWLPLDPDGTGGNPPHDTKPG